MKESHNFFGVFRSVSRQTEYSTAVNWHSRNFPVLGWKGFFRVNWNFLEHFQELQKTSKNISKIFERIQNVLRISPSEKFLPKENTRKRQTFYFGMSLYLEELAFPHCVR